MFISNNNATTPVYLKIITDINPEKTGIDLMKIITDQNGIDIKGYFNEIIVSGTGNLNGGAIYNYLSIIKESDPQST